MQDCVHEQYVPRPVLVFFRLTRLYWVGIMRKPLASVALDEEIHRVSGCRGFIGATPNDAPKPLIGPDRRWSRHGSNSPKVGSNGGFRFGELLDLYERRTRNKEGAAHVPTLQRVTAPLKKSLRQTL